MQFRKGFTLIELLVVISIIALLMSIMMPALSKVKEEARKIACMSRLRQWAMPIQMYTSDNGGKFSKAVHSGIGNQQDKPYATFMGLYKDFWTKNPKMLLCPNATKTIQEGASDLGNRKGVYSQVKERLNTKVDYEFSYTYSCYCHVPPNLDGAPYYELYWKSIEQKDADLIPMWGDGYSPVVWPYREDPPPTYPGQPPAGGRGPGAGQMKRVCVNRHDGAVNQLFMDFTVRTVSCKQLWYLKWHREYDIPGPGDPLRIDWEKEAPWMTQLPEKID